MLVALFPDDVDVDDVAEAVVGVLKSPVGIPQQVELPAEVIVLVGELHSILALPENEQCDNVFCFIVHQRVLTR